MSERVDLTINLESIAEHPRMAPSQRSNKRGGIFQSLLISRNYSKINFMPAGIIPILAGEGSLRKAMQRSMSQILGTFGAQPMARDVSDAAFSAGPAKHAFRLYFTTSARDPLMAG